MARHSSIFCGLGAALLLTAAGCATDTSGGPSGSHYGPSGSSPENPFDLEKLRAGHAALVRAEDCTDLLTKVQDDAIAKLALAAERFRAGGYGTAQNGGTKTPGGPVIDLPSAQDAGTATPGPNAGGNPVFSGDSDSAGEFGGAAPPSGGLGAAPSPTPTTPVRDDASESEEPTSASNTNTQVEGVDEADFVKVVDNGKAMFLLHGTSLRKITTYPPTALADSGSLVTIEGQPSEFFVTEAGIAVVFSSVADSGNVVPYPVADVCTPFACGSVYNAVTKITVVDVSGASGKVLRELYYQGNYTSSRRYDAVVRVVLGAQAPYTDIFTPDIEVYDSFGHKYEDEEIEAQLTEWLAREEASIRRTDLSDWMPVVKERKNGALVAVAPTCDTYFAPEAGHADYGLTHVLSIDTANPSADIGGVTIVGGTSTVYSNAERLVLAQPDYRYDYGYVPEERTALHVFDLAGSKTTYRASGVVAGYLPPHNPQFGIDVAADGVLRVGTTGQRRSAPDAAPFSQRFFETTVENRVRTLGVKGEDLEVLGESPALGHEGESLQSMRFVGGRGYAVTFRQTDPLIVLDVSGSGDPRVLGEIEIPGFSQYMHPLDENHLITFGQSGTWSSQLQLFDVSHPESGIPAPKTFDFGSGSSSAASYDHKAFTYFAEQQLIGLPVASNWYDNGGYYRYQTGLHVIHVDAQSGFSELGVVDHSSLYASQGCGVCDALGCYSYSCYYDGASSPEVRRGHFVASDSATYVYSFSYAGVIATDIADFTDIASVKLPTPEFGYGGYYGGDIALPEPGRPPVVDPAPSQDGGTATTGG